MNNVFKLYFRPSYYLKHPIKFFKEIAANFLVHLTHIGIKEEIMVFSKETTIARIDYRINLLRARGEAMNMKLIAALEREKRNIENQ